MPATAVAIVLECTSCSEDTSPVVAVEITAAFWLTCGRAEWAHSGCRRLNVQSVGGVGWMDATVNNRACLLRGTGGVDALLRGTGGVEVGDEVADFRAAHAVAKLLELFRVVVARRCFGALMALARAVVGALDALVVGLLVVEGRARAQTEKGGGRRSVGGIRL